MIRVISIVLISFIFSFSLSMSAHARVGHRGLNTDAEKEIVQHTDIKKEIEKHELEKAVLDRKVKDCSDNTAAKCDVE
ncbi:MAG: hypothetical protein K2P93_07130 [Alphaproteobacteria bacterium]|nr:hypothetical protein [Alphaproteobacteria bacterium]